jgi:hypothetical protein
MSAIRDGLRECCAHSRFEVLVVIAVHLVHRFSLYFETPWRHASGPGVHERGMDRPAALTRLREMPQTVTNLDLRECALTYHKAPTLKGDGCRRFPEVCAVVNMARELTLPNHFS